MSVTERLDAVIDAASELKDVRSKLGKLEEERAELESRARQILEVLAESAAGALRPEDDVPASPPTPNDAGLSSFALRSPAPRTLTDRIMEFLNACAGAEFGATEVTAALGGTSDLNVNTIRGTLSRLNAEGRIAKTGYGKYRSRLTAPPPIPNDVDEGGFLVS